MKVIYNRVIPFKGFTAINLFGLLFVRKNDDGTCPELSETTLRHEQIHTEQMKEMLFVPFYLWYFIEWLVRLFTNTWHAYRSISFEQEAYGNEGDAEYLQTRKRYSWVKYLRTGHVA